MKILPEDLAPIIQEPCRLFSPDGTLIGEISCDHVLNHVRLKIGKNKLEGYYILFQDQKILINSRGRLSDWPKGFFDKWEIALNELLDL